jgi:hypothetical protein
MEAVRFPETLVTSHKTTRRHSQEDTIHIFIALKASNRIPHPFLLVHNEI